MYHCPLLASAPTHPFLCDVDKAQVETPCKEKVDGKDQTSVREQTPCHFEPERNVIKHLVWGRPRRKLSSFGG